jgi:radical SAM superfamily enzyme YgiQ (UPF0313 family)
MKQRVALVEFPVYDQMPLVSGYLEAFASTHDSVRASYDFVHFNERVGSVDYGATLAKLRALGAQVHCFSSYVWNMGLIRRLVADLEQDPQVEKIVLGGHQVSGKLKNYYDSSHDKVVVVNGEGETPFRDLLAALAEERDPWSVRGISCYVDGELYDGGDAEKIQDLDTLPSPFLNGYLDDSHSPITVFETNRGCPYKCSFCTWGGPTTKVTKFPLERVKQELEWLAKRGVSFLHIGDANWGMLKRDVEISEYIVELKRRYGRPYGIHYAAAKNQPKGSVACIEALHKGGVMTSQGIGIQSMSQDTLTAVGRKNIKNSAFVEMFTSLRDANISAFCELIWPLPLETLASLKQAFGQLLELNATTIVLYPTLLINNAEMTDDSERYGLVAAPAADWKSEIKMVRATSTASRADVDAGWAFYYAFFLLGNCDGHKAFVRFAQQYLGLSAVELIERFSAWLRSQEPLPSYVKLVDSMLADDAQGDLMSSIGRMATHALHEGRAEIQGLVARFLAEEFEAAPLERAVFTILWLAGMPRLFRNSTPISADLLAKVRVPGAPPAAQLATLTSKRPVTLAIESERATFGEMLRLFGVQAPGEPSEIRVQDRAQNAVRMLYTTDAEKNHVYAHGMVQRLGEITPDFVVRG